MLATPFSASSEAPSTQTLKSAFAEKNPGLPIIFRIVPENGTLGVKHLEDVIRSWTMMQQLDMKLFGGARGGCWLRLCSEPLHGCEMAAQGLQAMLHETLGGDYYIAYGNAADHPEGILLEAMTASAESARTNRLTRPINIAHELTAEGVNLFRAAVASRMLRSHLQPIVSLESMRPCGYETLARIFVNRTDTMQNSRWIEQVMHSHDSLRLACIMIAKARKKLLDGNACPYSYLSVNVTGKDLADIRIQYQLNDLEEQVRSRMVLEITEWHDVLRVPNISTAIRQLRKSGFRIALDDFGAANSSFQVLRKIEVDIIKINRDLILSHMPLDMSIIDMMVHYARTQDIKLVAEGVETASIMKKVSEHGIHYAQGWYMDKLCEQYTFLPRTEEEKTPPLLRDGVGVDESFPGLKHMRPNGSHACVFKPTSLLPQADQADQARW